MASWKPNDTELQPAPDKKSSNKYRLKDLKRVLFVREVNSYTKPLVKVKIMEGKVTSDDYWTNDASKGSTIEVFADAFIQAGKKPTDDYSIW